MAKAKKTESAKEATPKAAPKPAAKKQSKPAAHAGGTPLIDTSLVAQAAAAAIGNKALLHQPQQQEGPSEPREESSLFKQLKQNVAKPGSKGLGQFLQDTAGPATRKSNQPFGGAKQVGHNQTFGADVNRTGVPRRTGG